MLLLFTDFHLVVRLGQVLGKGKVPNLTHAPLVLNSSPDPPKFRICSTLGISTTAYTSPMKAISNWPSAWQRSWDDDFRRWFCWHNEVYTSWRKKYLWWTNAGKKHRNWDGWDTALSTFTVLGRYALMASWKNPAWGKTSHRRPLPTLLVKLLPLTRLTRLKVALDSGDNAE